MELEECLLKRRSVRKFTSEEVSDEQIDKIMHAASSGPSAMNKKPWEFYVVKDKELIKKLKSSSLYTNYDAPLAIIVAGNLTRALPLAMKEFWVQDTSAATENILLEVTNLGLGSVWCGIYPQKIACSNVSKILSLPKHIVPLNVIWVGHPIDEVESRDQYNKDNIHIL